MAGRRRRLLAVCYGGGHVRMLLPVLQRLRARPELEVLALGLTTAGGVLAGAGIPHLGFRDLVVHPDDDAALAKGEALAGTLAGHGAVSAAETAAYLGLSYRDLELAEGPDAAAASYREAGRGCFLPRHTLRRFIARLAPDLVVATNSPRAERAAIEAAGELGITAVCVTDLFLQHESEWIARPGYASKVTVLAEGVRRFLAEKGRDPADIVVTGNPAFDGLAGSAAAAAGRRLRRRSNWQSKKVVLWALPMASVKLNGVPFVDQASILQQLAALVAEAPEFVVVVRPHPNRPEPPAALPAGFRLSPPGEDLTALLHAVDYVVVETSTVGLEAALLGKKVVTVRARGYPPYAEYGLATDIDAVEALPEALRRARTPDRARLGMPATGQSAACVCAVIMDQLRQPGG